MQLYKKFRFAFLFLVKVIKRRYLAILASLILGIICFFLYPKVLALLPAGRMTEKIGIIGQFTVNDLPEEILFDISFGLTKIDGVGKAVANLAENWEATDEGKTYSFVLSEDNRYWHDNTLFSPKDINYNFKDVSYTQNGNSIVFSLKESFSPFPVIISKPLFKKGLVGLGDYKVKNIVRKGNFIDQISLVPFKKGKLLNRTYRFYDNEEALKSAFNLGEINHIRSLFDADGIYPGTSVNINETTDKNTYVAVFFNTDNPLLSDKSYRQALAYATPKDFGGSRAIGPLSSTSWAYNPDVKPYAYNVTRARELLVPASADDKTQETTLKIATLPRYEKIAQSISDSWKSLNIKSEVVINPFIPDDFDVLLAARSIPRDPDQYYFWHSTQKGNITGLKSPKIDKLLEDGRMVIDQEERKAIYFDFQRALSEECPAVFLFYPVSYQVIRK